MAHFHIPKPLHGWREFAGEVGIIVLGVVIALGFEQLVDTWQWHRKIGRAEAAMRLELGEDNGPQAYGRMLIGRCLDMQIQRIHDGAGRVPTAQLRAWALAYAPPFRTWDIQAWQTVLGSDVGSHMGPERLIEWSSPYRVLTPLTDENRRERQLSIQLHETIPPTTEPSPADLQSLRQITAQLQSENTGLYRASELVLARSRRLGAEVPQDTKTELLKEARALYGDCVRVPNLDAPPAAQRLSTNLHPQPPTVGP